MSALCMRTALITAAVSVLITEPGFHSSAIKYSHWGDWLILCLDTTNNLFTVRAIHIYLHTYHPQSCKVWQLNLNTGLGKSPGTDKRKNCNRSVEIALITCQQTHTPSGNSNTYSRSNSNCSSSNTNSAATPTPWRINLQPTTHVTWPLPACLPSFLPSYPSDMDIYMYMLHVERRLPQ